MSHAGLPRLDNLSLEGAEDTPSGLSFDREKLLAHIDSQDRHGSSISFLAMPIDGVDSERLRFEGLVLHCHLQFAIRGERTALRRHENQTVTAKTPRDSLRWRMYSQVCALLDEGRVPAIGGEELVGREG